MSGWPPTNFDKLDPQPPLWLRNFCEFNHLGLDFREGQWVLYRGAFLLAAFTPHAEFGPEEILTFWKHYEDQHARLRQHGT